MCHTRKYSKASTSETAGEGSFGSVSVDFEEQYDKIYRYCYFKVHKQELAEDITQETFLRFIRKYGVREEEWVLRYLYRIAHNLCVDEYKNILWMN